MGTNYHFCPDVVKCEAQEGYVLRVWFEDGKVKDCDLSDIVERGVFRKLHNRTYFKLARVYQGFVKWGEVLDLAPEYLYEKGSEIDARDTRRCSV